MYKLVAIIWDDAECQHDECTVDDLSESCLMTTYGALVKENENSVWVAAEVFEDGRFRSTTRIPKGMIKERKNLIERKLPKPRKKKIVEPEIEEPKSSKSSE